MPNTATGPAPSSATRAELRKIARSLRQVRTGQGSAQARTYILIDGLDERQSAKGSVQIAVSPEALDYIARLLAGSEVVVKEVTARRASGELTTQQAADQLGVSRPYLIKLLEAGKIPFRRVGHFRRIRVEDLAAFERAEQERRRAGLRELADITQDIGLDY